MTKKHIQNIYPRDKNALTTLAKCGYASHEQLREFLRDKRISGYCKDGLIEKSVYSQHPNTDFEGVLHPLLDAAPQYDPRYLPTV